MRLAIAALTLALCACSREPSFDERFSESENEIEDRARELDEQLNGAEANGTSDVRSEVQPD